jgi:hypothetical protein
MDFLEGLELNLDKDREELRGIFVLGVIATLLTSREFLDFLVLGVPIRVILLGIILMWGAYAFFMVVGISGDWVNEPIVKVCYLMAYTLFVTGIGGTIGTFVTVLFALYVAPHFPLLVQDISILELGVGVSFFVAIKLGKGPGFAVKGQNHSQDTPQPEQTDE